MGLSAPGESDAADIESSELYADMRRRLEVSIRGREGGEWGVGSGGGVGYQWVLVRWYGQSSCLRDRIVVPPVVVVRDETGVK